MKPFQRPRRLWPQTLFGRNLLLIIGLLLLSQIVWLVVFRHFVQSPRLERLGANIEAQIGLFGDAIALIPDNERTHALTQLQAAHPDTFFVTHTNEMPPGLLVTPPPQRIAFLIAPLAQRLGQNYQIFWQAQPEKKLWIRVHKPPYDAWFGYATRGIIPESGTIFVASALLTTLLALVGAALLQRRMHRPLQQLSLAAKAIAEGDACPPLANDGPTEISLVTQQFQKMAESLENHDRERVVMLAGVSHDLRTPLSKLRLCVEMMRSGNDPELIESMIRSIDAADDIIGQFIDFARIGSNEPEQLCDLAELINAVVAKHKPSGASKITLITQIESLPPQTVRPVALQRAIGNLIENAMRYAPGEITITLQAKNNDIAFSVLDRGPGIPDTELLRITQPFVRMETAHPAIHGAGLGLAIVDRIAKQHHGRFSLVARAGGGLIATFQIPSAR